MALTCLIKNNSDFGHIVYETPSNKVITNIENKSVSKDMQENINNKESTVVWFFLVFLPFLGLLLRHMEIPRL